MRRATLLLGAILLAACGSLGNIGDLGGILGSPNPSTPSAVQATVNFVDTQAQRIDVNVNNVNNLNTSQAGQSIYYDAQTVVTYQGNQSYRVTDLERGDQISVQGRNENGRYVASTITVTRNVRTGT